MIAFSYFVVASRLLFLWNGKKVSWVKPFAHFYKFHKLMLVNSSSMEQMNYLRRKKRYDRYNNSIYFSIRLIRIRKQNNKRIYPYLFSFRQRQKLVISKRRIMSRRVFCTTYYQLLSLARPVHQRFHIN